MVSQKPLLEPDSILRRTMSAIIGPQQKLGVMVPERDQQEDIVRRWAKYIPNQVITDYGTPYGQDRELIEMAAYRLKNEPVDYIVLDCLGYSQAMKETVEAITKKPVIIPRMLIAHIMMAMF